MAVTVTVDSCWTSVAGKTLNWQSALTSKLKIVPVEATFGCCDTYCKCCGGNTVDLSACGRIGTVIEAIPISNNISATVEYVKATGGAAATGKVKLHGDQGAAANGAHEEFDNGNTDIQGKKIRFLVIGF